MCSFLLSHVSCSEKRSSEPTGVFTKDSVNAGGYDLADIEQTGEIIMVTMYGRDTYYNYHGKSTGLAYELMSNYATSDGLRVRVETVKDTISMIRMLLSGEADVIACELPSTLLEKHDLTACGAFGNGIVTINGEKVRASWAVRRSQTDLAQSLDEWYTPSLKEKLRSAGYRHTGTASVRRKVRTPYLSRAKGVISQYDALFMQGSRAVGWDWRLIAAQCYQESGFDPEAVSWAGAKGLMQIIPSTAKHLGISNVYDPAENIAAGCRYLKELQNKFSDVRSRYDRICFTLAAYNGGYHHVRDAMNLAAKKGKNPDKWEEVCFFVLNLEKPQYYNDPIVKYGFMIGSETYYYVESIMLRWSNYRSGKPVSMDSDAGAIMPMPSKRKNRFTKKQQIISLKDSV